MRWSFAEDLVPSLVEHEVVEPQDVARQLAGGAAQDRLDARDDLGEAERLGDVVVAAGPEGLDLVLDATLRRQEEDRRPEAALAQALPDLDPVDVGEHPVEDDQVGLEGHRLRERVAAGSCLLDLVALVAKRGRDGVDDRRLVVDDEDLPAFVRYRLCVHDRIVATNPVGRLREPQLEPVSRL